MQAILLATDGSPSSRQATAFAIELAQATGWGAVSGAVVRADIEINLHNRAGVLARVVA